MCVQCMVHSRHVAGKEYQMDQHPPLLPLHFFLSLQINVSIDYYSDGVRSVENGAGFLVCWICVTYWAQYLYQQNNNYGWLYTVCIVCRHACVSLGVSACAVHIKDAVTTIKFTTKQLGRGWTHTYAQMLSLYIEATNKVAIHEVYMSLSLLHYSVPFCMIVVFRVCISGIHMHNQTHDLL